jgi:hypothetical protein
MLNLTNSAFIWKKNLQILDLKKFEKKKKTDTYFPFKQSQQVVIKSSNKINYFLPSL